MGQEGAWGGVVGGGGGAWAGEKGKGKVMKRSEEATRKERTQER